MSSPVVEEILQRIEQLSAEDRLLLEERLVERAEAEWKQETEKVRQLARQRGLDQSAIDRAIQELRYPS
jgi:hypothetical protein